MPATITRFLDTRRVKKTKIFSVKFRFTFERGSKEYQTIYNLSKEEYDKLNASRISADLQLIKDQLKEIERDAAITARNLLTFTFSEFENKFILGNKFFLQRKRKNEAISFPSIDFDYTPFFKKCPILEMNFPVQNTIGFAYLNNIKRLIREGRIGTVVTYHGSYVSLNKFRGNVRFIDINVSYLTQYEHWLLEKNISKTTVNMCLLPLRTMFNEVIEDGIVKKELYPFGRRKYQIPNSKNIKRSLTLDDIQKIYYYECNPLNIGEQKAKDFWLFSYFANGMNPKDIVRLKFKNINDNYIYFERSKTERSMRSDPKIITVFITDDMKSIIGRWANKDMSPNNYVFPILEQGLTPLRQYELNQLFVGLINDWMKRILKSLGIDKKATTYVARHTFSTVMKRSGVSTEYIQEALGHSDIKTTENYLDSFDKEVKKEFAQLLTAFKK